jgi:hypothetical protein
MRASMNDVAFFFRINDFLQNAESAGNLYQFFCERKGNR